VTKNDNDTDQSFHMQSQRRILGVKWYDKMTNTATKETDGLADLPSLITDRRHSLFGHICQLSKDTPVSQALHRVWVFVTVGPARVFCRPFCVDRSNLDRSFSGTRFTVSFFVFALCVLRPIAGPARELPVTDLSGARKRARLVLLNQLEL